MDATLWDAAGADLSVPGLAALVAEFLEYLGLHGVTVAGNDTGGAIVQALAAGHPWRVGRIALVSCDAFGNFPPGLTGKALVAAGKLPPALFGAFMQQMRLKPARRAPFAFGWAGWGVDSGAGRS
jgi:pimeloyl-ACP methyl ester carboxylesterase